MSADFWRGKRVLVTGGSGFVGSHFVEALSRHGAGVVATYCRHSPPQLDGAADWHATDLRDEGPLRELCHGVDVVISCAALDGNTEFKRAHAAEILDVNARIASSVLCAAQAATVADVVVISSAEIYAAESPQPIVEESDHKVLSDYIRNGYVLAKRYAETLSELYADQYRLSVFIPRLTNAYGPRDRNLSRVVPSLITKTLAGEPIELWGDGTQVRQFMFVSDVVEAVLQMVADRRNRVLNIAPRETVSLRKLAELVAAACAVKTQLTLHPDKPTGGSRILATDRLYEVIDFTPRSVVDGLAETVAWYRRHIEPLRLDSLVA